MHPSSPVRLRVPTSGNFGGAQDPTVGDVGAYASTFASVVTPVHAADSFSLAVDAAGPRADQAGRILGACEPGDAVWVERVDPPYRHTPSGGRVGMIVGGAGAAAAVQLAYAVALNEADSTELTVVVLARRWADRCVFFCDQLERAAALRPSAVRVVPVVDLQDGAPPGAVKGPLHVGTFCALLPWAKLKRGAGTTQGRVIVCCDPSGGLLRAAPWLALKSGVSARFAARAVYFNDVCASVLRINTY